MFIYLVTFCFSLIFTSLAYRCYKHNEKVLFYLCSLIAIGLPSLLAGLRNETVGTDTLNYINYFTQATLYNNFSSYYKNYIGVEIGYLVLNFLVAHLSTSVSVFFIITHTIIVSSIYISAFKLQKYLNPTWVMFIFLFMSFNESLNILRQYIAISLSLLAFSDFITHRSFIRYFIINIIGFTFHHSSIICFIFPIIYLLLDNKPFKKELKKLSIISLCLVSIYILLQKINIPFLSDFFSYKYLRYVSDGKGEVSSSTVLIYLYISFIIITTTIRRSNKIFNTLSVISILAIVFCTLGAWATTLYRLSIYPFIINIISIPLIFKLRPKSYKIIKPIFVTLIICYWFYSIIYKGSNETIPYQTLLIGK